MTITPEEEAGRLLAGKNLTLAVAESCTGGLISHRLTNIPGSSEYFLGGFVTYSNIVKETVLGVEHHLIEEYGAVSTHVVQSMARGARRLAGADVSLAVSGIAGPTGGTAEKQVGLVFIAVDGVGGTKVAKYNFKGDRLSIKDQSAHAALDMLKEALVAGNYSVGRQ